MEVKKEVYPHPNGDVVNVKPYLNGVRHGLHQTFSRGKLSQMSEFLDDTGQNWDYYEFHTSGGLSFRMPMRNSKQNGVCLCWNEDGVLEQRDVWKDDELHGLYTKWHPNGQKKWEVTYINDKMNGTFTEWYTNGQKKKELTYSNDQEEGKCTEWNEQGEVTSITYYQNGEVVPEGSA